VSETNTQAQGEAQVQGNEKPVEAPKMDDATKFMMAAQAVVGTVFAGAQAAMAAKQASEKQYFDFLAELAKSSPESFKVFIESRTAHAAGKQEASIERGRGELAARVEMAKEFTKILDNFLVNGLKVVEKTVDRVDFNTRSNHNHERAMKHFEVMARQKSIEEARLELDKKTTADRHAIEMLRIPNEAKRIEADLEHSKGYHLAEARRMKEMEREIAEEARKNGKAEARAQ
jgi:hypothetical protein